MNAPTSPRPAQHVRLRDAAPDDAGAIAALHAANWAATYSAVLDAGWVARSLAADRAAVWAARLAQPAPTQRVCVAEDATDGRLLGFACWYLDAHAQWGSLLENLHVAAGARGTGLGERLLREAARRAQAERPGTGWHLSVERHNAAARGFYEHLGARVLAEEPWDTPDGGHTTCDVMGWPSARAAAGPGDGA